MPINRHGRTIIATHPLFVRLSIYFFEFPLTCPRWFVSQFFCPTLAWMHGLQGSHHLAGFAGASDATPAKKQGRIQQRRDAIQQTKRSLPAIAACNHRLQPSQEEGKFECSTNFQNYY
jgi:hypothetical protein